VTHLTTSARSEEATRRALGVWFGSRLAVALTALGTGYVLSGTRLGSTPSWLHSWYHWDVALYIKIAEFGYGGYPEHYSDTGVAAFFPGLPLLLRAVHYVVPSYVAAGLLISLVAGGVASVALARLAEDEGAPGALAVLALVVSPYAVFLAAGYSEALFLALALPGWLAARRRAWPAAGALVALACTVRVTGLFLAAALVVHYLVTERRLPWSAWPLLLPAIPVGLFMVHLHAVGGDWLAWPHAQARVWGRDFTWPWTSLHTTWTAATRSGQQADFAWQFRADIAAMILGVVLTVALLVWRRWGEATYVGLQVAALATSSFYLSVGRATLLWWPLWIVLARLGARRPAAYAVYLCVATPLMFVAVVGFTSGSAWVG
jgi:hypothetical protein